ncbi:MAG: hypothetical protein LC803_22015 [Acidobacteria bacterium]|nr:hypothetical protein [Acidobacteriota bacterium]
MEIDGSSLLALLKEQMSNHEVRKLAMDLSVDWDSLEGDSNYKASELVLYLLRNDRLNELVSGIQKVKPNVFEKIRPNLQSKSQNSELEKLSSELGSLRQQLMEFQKEPLLGGQFEHRVREILSTANRAVDQSEVLTARVILPRQEDMNVRLVPSHSLERLEEYRRDENVAYLFIGVFAGAIFGTLSNWATTETFLMTRSSVLLVSVLSMLTIACIIWVRVIQKRANVVRGQIFLNDK